MRARRIAAGTAAAALGLAALSSAPESRPVAERVYLPAAFKAAPALRLEPATTAGLMAALALPGARVEPVPGTYHLPEPARVARGVSLYSYGTELQGYGLLLEDTADVRIEGLRITRCRGDAITLERATGIVLVGLDLSRCTDGLIDITRGSSARIYRSRLHDHEKCSLIGKRTLPSDAAQRVLFQEVTFSRCAERLPLVRYGVVTVRDSIVEDWQGAAAEAERGGTIILERVRYVRGCKSHKPYLEEGGTVINLGISVTEYPDGC